MSKSLAARVEALEKAVGGIEPVCVIWDMTGGNPLTGYEWGEPTEKNGVSRKPGESDRQLLNRATAAAMNDHGVAFLMAVSD